MVNIIVAVGNYVSNKGFPIGVNGNMPWRNKNDLKWFRYCFPSRKEKTKQRIKNLFNNKK